MTSEISPSERVDESCVGERFVLYHRDSRQALVLNPSGSWLWGQLKTRPTREQLIAGLQQRYHLSPEQAGHDLDQFLADLRRHDAIVGL